MSSARPASGISSLPEVRTAVVGAAFLPAAGVAHRLDVGVPAAVAAFAAACLLGSLGLRAAYAVLLGVTAWATLTGFVVNDLGRLTVAVADLARLGLLACSALAGSWAGSGRRQSQPRRRKSTSSTATISSISSSANG